ncbi:sensor histidine kinase [Hyunsoonleella rubra]|uniref:Sensor histidine kinase n=1 Tax=Hyunsoonleella rubra TaxID=1737062 RepID=A0ABW5TDU7_9FLAO
MDSISVVHATNAYLSSETESCKFKGESILFHFYLNNNDFDKALSIINRQEQLLNTFSCKGQFQYQLLNNKSIYYRAINDLENLSNFAFKTLESAERLKDPKKEIDAIQHIVFVFTRLNEDDKNWSYIKRAQKLIEVLKPSKETAPYLRWLAQEYETKYTLTERETLIDSALLFINKSKTIALKYDMNAELSETYKVLEGCAYHKKNFSNAVTYIDSSIYYAKTIKGNVNLGPLYIYKSWDLLEMEQVEEVNKNLDSALKYDKSSGGGKMYFYHEVSAIYEGIGKRDKALHYYKKYASLKDSVLNIKTLEKVNDMEQKYNKVANENKIVQLEKTKQFYLFLILGSLLTLLTFILLFRQRALKNKHKIMLTEQRLNKARMDPHFFFNAMASLQNLSLEENSPNTSLFVSRFAKIMRQSLENTYEDLIPLEDEIDFLKHYLEIQKLRYPDKFDFKFSIDDTLEIDELYMPSMILQPFVENAIEHGFKNINFKGMLNVGFKDLQNVIQITVRDNGKGFETKPIEKEYKSRAMQIIKDRLYLFNVQHKSNAKYIVSQKVDGFEIEIELPKLYQI